MMNPPIHRRLTQAIILFTLVLTLSGSVVAQTVVNSGSARAHGMGDAGASFIDHRSYTANPASFALFAPSHDIALTVGPFLWADNEKYGRSWSLLGSAVSLGSDRFWRSSKFCLGAAYTLGRLSNGEHGIVNEGGYVVGTFEPGITSHNITLSIGYDAGVRIGLGATLRRSRTIGYGPRAMSIDTSSASSLEIGFQITRPRRYERRPEYVPVLTEFNLYPTLGVLVKNLASDVEAELRVSLGLLMALEEENFAHAGLLVVLEIERSEDKYYRLTGNKEYVHLGAEFTFKEMLSLRYGWVDRSIRKETLLSYGVGVSSRGIARLIKGDSRPSDELTGRSILSRTSLEISYSKYNNGSYRDISGVGFLDLALVVAL